MLGLYYTYRAIRDDVDGLINFLKPMEEKFIPIEIEERKEYFYKQRDRFNELKGMENNNVDFEKLH